MKRLSLLVGLVGLTALVGIAAALLLASPADAQSPNPMNDPVEVLVPEVIATYPHDSSAWTQGLLFYDGSVYESTGSVAGGEDSPLSTLREVDYTTGEILRLYELPRELYAEGLARVDDTLVQITWKDEVATVYDIDTFEVLDQYTYSGEGWGLCYDGSYLYMSDGTPFLHVRDAETFELLFSLAVTYQSWTISAIPSQGGYANLSRLNELECVGDYVYANVWKSDYILRIDKHNGIVTALIDASGLVSDDERESFDAGRDVLNGIVYLPETDTFLLTGKRWPTMYEVRLAPPQP